MPALSSVGLVHRLRRCGIKAWQRAASILGAVLGALVLYVVVGVSILSGNGKPSGSGGGGAG